MIMKLKNGEWVDVAGGANGQVHDMVIFNEELYISGIFSSVGNGIAASNIAKWTGDRWCGLGSEFNNRILTMEVFNGELYIGGGFTKVDDDSIQYIAKWIAGDFTGPCGEPLGVESENEETVYAFPNPAQLVVNFYLPYKYSDAELFIYNSNTQIVLTYHLTAGNNNVSLINIPPGIYIYEFLKEGQRLSTGKLVRAED